jgi:hypothetical protein
MGVRCACWPHANTAFRTPNLSTSSRAPTREKPDRCHWAARVTEPAQSIARLARVRSLECRGVTFDGPPRRHPFWKNQDAPNHGGPPAEPVVDDLRGQPNLCVVSSDRLLNRHDLRFHFVDRHGLHGFVDGQQVDRASFSISREGHFWNDNPATRPRGPRGHFDELGVALVEEAVEFPATPRDEAIETGAECGEDATNCRNRESCQEAALEPGNRRLAAARFLGEVDLAPTQSTPHRPTRCADSSVVHRRTLSRSASFLRIGDVTEGRRRCRYGTSGGGSRSRRKCSTAASTWR